MPFIPLHVTTSYSFLESSIKFDELFLRMKELKYGALGISDLNTLYAYPSFYNYCKKYRIKPIFGLDCILENNRLTLYFDSEKGYKNICFLSFYLSYKQEINLEILSKHSDELYCIVQSDHSKIFDNVNINDIRSALLPLLNIFGENLLIGLENYSLHGYKDFNKEKVDRVRKFVSKFPYKLLAFPSINCLDKKDAISLKILQAIKNNDALEDGTINEELYLKTTDELSLLYTKEEIEETYIFAKKLSAFKYDVKRGELLNFNHDINSKELLHSLAFKGLEKFKLISNKNYLDRLNYELDIIDKMGYNDYFLIVADYVRFAKENNILVGPGRGSAAGSLVSFALNITTIDPIKYDLLFERFLNIDRISLPDIDIDFEDIKREQIVSYLKSKYGKERVSNIVTMQTFQAKQALRDVARIRNSVELINNVTKYLTNPHYNLKESYENINSFKDAIDNDLELHEIYRLALTIEGLPRQKGLHAAGIVLNNTSLISNLPITYDASLDVLVSQYEMNYLENYGFLKMDLLGLTNLTSIKDILNLIKLHHNIDIDLEAIPLDDPKVFSLINKNMTMGIFQLESAGMNNAINEVKPTTFLDISSILSLFRPGPMEFIKDYAKRKNNNEQYVLLDSRLSSILDSTYGIIIYQEQIMQIAQKIAGFTLSEADILRRAISKKKEDSFIELEEKFVLGATKNGVNKETAISIYELIKKFASYGFNKAHSISYAMISYRMAYLKAHYPMEFYIVTLKSIASNDKKFIKYVKEIKMNNVNVLLPNINLSTLLFEKYENSLIAPLTLIKGLMQKDIESIIYERDTFGAYKDIFDFIYRMQEYNMNYNTIEILIESGCFDSFLDNRESLKETLPSLVQRANLMKKSGGQGTLFEEKIIFKNVKEDKYKKIIKEHDLLGLFISDNPIIYNEKGSNYDSIKDHINKKYINIVCFTTFKKVITTRKNKKEMAFIQVIDKNDDMIDVTVFPDNYDKYANILAKDTFYKMRLKVEFRNSKYDFILEKLERID